MSLTWQEFVDDPSSDVEWDEDENVVMLLFKGLWLCCCSWANEKKNVGRFWVVGQLTVGCSFQGHKRLLQPYFSTSTQLLQASV
jgi:hypothetical protein